MIIEETRKCTYCKKTKPVTEEYFKWIRSSDRFTTGCIRCLALKSSSRKSQAGMNVTKSVDEVGGNELLDIATVNKILNKTPNEPKGDHTAIVRHYYDDVPSVAILKRDTGPLRSKSIKYNKHTTECMVTDIDIKKDLYCYTYKVIAK